MKTDLSKFEGRYAVEKAPEAKRGCPPDDVPWLWQIPCWARLGGAHVYTHSETHLGYMSSMKRSMPGIRLRLLEILGPDALW